jgi:glycosyltransferase involved in cell wall biosynthesis
LKVVIPVGALHVGGGCKVLVDTAHALLTAGHEVEIVIPEGKPVEYEVHCKLTKIPSLMAEHIPYGDIVLPNFYSTFLPSFQAWPKQCVRFSLGFEPYWVPKKHQALWSYRQHVPTISISHWLAEQIHRHGGPKSRVINLGVDPHIYYPDKTKGRGTEQETKTILYIARDPKSGYQMKGYEEFLKAMKQVKKKYSGKFIVNMICTERNLSLPGIPLRTFAPKCESEMAELYRSADLFVSTSWFEGFALPPLEAMACGTPVVTTNSGGILDFCSHRKSAYIVQPKDPKLIAKGIVQVLSKERLAQKLVKHGLKSARNLTKSYFEQQIVNVLERIYQEKNP